jgi:ABC-2 type transport system permease protein
MNDSTQRADTGAVVNNIQTADKARATQGCDTAPVAGASAPRLPNPAVLLVAQIRYQMRLLLSSGRAVVVGFGLPIILLVATSRDHPDVSGFATFGLTVTAWTSYGVRLVTAREAGVLKRWRAAPLPRWCYLLGSISATALAATLAGAVTVGAGVLFYGTHVKGGPTTYIDGRTTASVLIVFVLASLAWASTVTALSSVIPTVDASFPILMFTYFPLVIISGALGAIDEPHWLMTFATYLPAQPLIDAVNSAAQHTAGTPFLQSRDVIVLACWAAGGLIAAVLCFRWEPHRPVQRRAARATA